MCARSLIIPSQLTLMRAPREKNNTVTGGSGVTPHPHPHHRHCRGAGHLPMTSPASKCKSNRPHLFTRTRCFCSHVRVHEKFSCSSMKRIHLKNLKSSPTPTFICRSLWLLQESRRSWVQGSGTSTEHYRTSRDSMESAPILLKLELKHY